MPTSQPTRRPTRFPTSKPTLHPTAKPAAGAKLVAPTKDGAWWHEVSEDGRLTSNFTVALTSEPLSRVHLDFGSRFGGLRFDPPALVFDYSNYSRTTLVRVSAYDDDVDQGDAHGELVVTATWTEDDYTECDEARPARTCGQAAAYGGFQLQALGNMTATVYDNDAAGVTVVAKDSLNATFDNYGDALLPGIYYLVLNSQPTNDVAVSVSGFSAFADGGSGAGKAVTVSFNALTWNVPAAMSVAASAPTAARPACGSGNRYCAAVANRTELLSHTATSDDAYYQNIAVAGVSVAVAVAYDATDPPKVASARFGTLLNSLVVTLDQASDRAGLSGSFACNKIFNLTAAEVAYGFGTGAKCSFLSDALLKVTFGKSPTVLEGDVASLRNEVLQASASAASLFTRNASFAVAAPSVPKSPAVGLSASSLFVGRCDSLTVGGHGATLSGGRELTYVFSATALNGFSVANLTAALNVNNLLNNGKGTSSVTLASSTMAPGSKFAITLTVSAGV